MLKTISQISLAFMLILTITVGATLAGNKEVKAKKEDDSQNMLETNDSSSKAQNVGQAQFGPQVVKNSANPPKNTTDKAEIKPQKPSATILSYNFIFYIIHKFKYMDILSGVEKKDKNTNSLNLGEKLSELSHKVLNFFVIPI